MEDDNLLASRGHTRGRDDATDWRRYSLAELRAVWPSLSYEQKCAIARDATRIPRMAPAPVSNCEAWTSAEGATPDEIVELQRLGFKVEDLGAEYGLGHQGAFRWINILAGEFQQNAESHSEAEAWDAAKGAAAANERTIP